MKLEWEECPRPGCLWIGRADGCRYLATSGEEKLKIQGEHNAYIEQIAAANGYVKLEPGQYVVQAHPFTDEEVNYLLSAIEAQKCADCRETCSQERCIYLALRTKLNAIRAALDASGVPK